MVTIKMIAQQCGLSTAAVSRALNHLPGISAENAERVRQIAKEMGYYPNVAARTLKTKRSHTLGVLYRNTMAHELFSMVLEGIRKETESCSYDLIFLNSEPGVSYLEHAVRLQCDGVIIAQGDYPSASVDTLIQSELPVVSIEYVYPGHSAILSNNVEAMEEIVGHLAELGHRRIAFIHGEIGPITKERLAGFHRACRRRGINVPEEYVVQAKYRSVQLAGEITRQLMQLPVPPSCILYPDDVCYLGGLAELKRMGLSVPEDVSCVGFDGVQIASYLQPSLFTYHQDAMEMGRQAAREAIMAIDDPKCYFPRSVIVPGKLITGDSVKRLQD